MFPGQPQELLGTNAIFAKMWWYPLQRLWMTMASWKHCTVLYINTALRMCSILDIHIALLLSWVSNKFLWLSCEPGGLRMRGQIVFSIIAIDIIDTFGLFHVSEYSVICGISQSPSLAPFTIRKWMLVHFDLIYMTQI